jgi:hypothetical protein
MKFIKITLIIILLLSNINFTYSATDNVDEIWGNEPTGNVDSDFEPNGDNNGRGPVGGGPPGGGGPPDTPVSPWPILLIGTVYIWYLNHNKQTKLFTTNK